MYLYKVLQRSEEDWTNVTLKILESKRVGWYKKIQTTLALYDLPTDFHIVKQMRPRAWKKLVQQKVEIKNKERLYQDCHKKENGGIIPKTKTAKIATRLAEHDYMRKPENELLQMTKYEIKTILIARFGMLQCGINFKGTEKPQCERCQVNDDENHRLNFCPRWGNLNLCNMSEKVTFDLIYSNEVATLRNVVGKIEKVWNTKNAHGTMRAV